MNEPVSKRSLTDNSLNEFLLVVFINFLMPIFDIALPIFIWYQYETQDGVRLTYDYYWPVSAALIFFGIAKILFYAWNAFILYKTLVDKTFLSNYRIFYRLTNRGVSAGIIPLLFVDGCQEIVRYFYYTRYTMAKKPVEGGVYLSTLYQMVKCSVTVLTAISFFKTKVEEKHLQRKNSKRAREGKLQKALELVTSLEDYEESLIEEIDEENSVIQASLTKNSRQPFPKPKAK